MKITSSEIIKSGEQELIDAITAEINWGTIEQIFNQKYNLGIGEKIEYKRGEITVHENQVAYLLEFEIKTTISVLLDREGNHISVDMKKGHELHQEEKKRGSSE